MGSLDADGVVRQLGQAGRFHCRVYALLALVAVQVGLLHTTYIFLAGRVPYSYNSSNNVWGACRKRRGLSNKPPLSPAHAASNQQCAKQCSITDKCTIYLAYISRGYTIRL
ncbi:hypothetical protein B5X24_HaOG204871 [Helicoverpa armigera]|uniref:Uncharacterized protein n=1 Tax=Helicoverpa armigera TaxID=29058 RepID=A0A2W1BRM6_HELAM|nr:hypothetical protein B5X24_HaOG213518 [Helicoverpa armigera]PZC76265.1 hypothetical protein B5X24_HaOG204871 [Helicoverpa armigera]